MSIYELTLSVHQLVDFLLRSGDIDNRIFNREAMNEGSRFHSYYQNQQNENYISEYPLKHTFNYENYKITLQGRADGIILDKGNYIIDEIKTTVDDLNDFKNKNYIWHLGQAKCYGLLFMIEREIDFVQIRLSYFKQQSKEKMFIVEDLHFKDAEKFVFDLFRQYLDFYNIIIRNRNLLNETSKKLQFPFKNYRKGQKKLAKFVYFSGKNNKKLFVEAPTGIGKTMSCLFPFVKLLNEDEKSKIFYLTAKNSGKVAAKNALDILLNSGLSCHSIIVNAKEKMCPFKNANCNPDECELTVGYYNKLAKVLSYYLQKEQTFDKETILDIAAKEKMCPFELSLDLSLYCDLIICDYNYFFDPLVYMKRYFDEDASSFLILIDEAHNLVERSKEMYSAKIDLSAIKKYKKENKNIENAKLKRSINKLIKLIKNYDENCPNENNILSDLLEKTYTSLKNFYNTYLDISKNDNKVINNELNEIFLQVNKFLKIYDFYSDCYLLYFHKKINKKYNSNFSLNLKCLDASKFLKSLENIVKSCVFFSATLTPFDYYADLLGGDKDLDPYLSLPSPFPIDNLLLMIAPNISIKYSNRSLTYEIVVDYIKEFISHKIGNYFIYVPSYEYLNNLSLYLSMLDADIYIQKQDMNDDEKIDFLDKFSINPVKTTIGIVVLGGTFSEGIDLVSDRLIGAVIIGVGLPRISFELDETVKYYDKKNMHGNDYVYVNPGMNKVMQAVGRVIRSEKDRGAVLLIDERYMLNKYQDLFKKEWAHYKVVFKKEDIKKLMNNFYK